ncbi:MAG: AsmA family protein [Alphaproteobacteria bacterium]|nr:AsmA family protein [Alphaproteobacteria bacterium]
MLRLLRFLLILVLGLVILALVAPVLIPAETYRDRLTQEASRVLNREVDLAGELSFQILPSVQFTARDVRLANADGFGEEPMAQMAQLRVGVELLPLLSRNVEISEFVLVDPVIRLEQGRAGNNWTFRAPDAPAPTSGGTFERTPGALPFDASFGDVRIENAHIIYRNGNEVREITGLTLGISLPSLDAPAALDGSLAADGERITFSGEVGSVRGVFEGAQTPLSLSLGGNLLTASLDGNLPESSDFAFDGRIDIDVPSVRTLAAFAGSPLPPGENMQRFAARGPISASASRIALTAESIAFDAITGNGSLAVALGGTRPAITGNLTLPRLDVTPYLPETAEGNSGGSNAGLPPWSTEEIDLSSLGLVDADLDLNVGLFEYGDIDIENVDLDVDLRNRRLDANLSNFDLYQGTGSFQVIANARTARPTYRLVANLDDLDAQPFLQAAAGFERLMGTGDVFLDVSSAGSSQAAIMSGLSGRGNFGFADGAIVGINVAETIRNVSSFFGTSGEAQSDTSSDDTDAAATGDAAQTDFSSLTGSFTVSAGRAENSDLALLSPLLRMGGAGYVDLGEQYLDYRLRPRLVASIEGQGGSADLQGVVIPVRIRGGFNDVSVGVDTEAVGEALLSSALSNALGGGNGQSRDPEDILRDSLLDAIGLGGSDESAEDTPSGEDTQEESQPDPAELLLQGLFNNLSRGSEESEDDNGNGDRNR